MHQEEVCGFAHSLGELRPPDERICLYKQFWTDGVDRWYGQCMTEEQFERVLQYVRKTALCDMPTWCQGLMWYVTSAPADAERYRSFPADFNINQDWDSVRMYRKDKHRPFYWCPDFWRRVLHRRVAMQQRERQERMQGITQRWTPEYVPQRLSMYQQATPAVKTGNVELLHGPTMVSAEGKLASLASADVSDNNSARDTCLVLSQPHGIKQEAVLDVEEHDVKPKLTLTSVSMQTQTNEGEVSPMGDAIVGEVSPKRRPSEVETPRMEESKKEVSPTVTAIDSGNLSVPAGDCMIIETPEREIPPPISAQLGHVAENAPTESTPGAAAASPGIDDDMSF